MLDWIFGSPLQAGTQAPDFEAFDQDGKPVRLRDLRGTNVVLVFYPADDTTVCRQQLCEFRDLRAEWTAKDTVVYGVNPQSAESHRDFAKKRELGFPILVDSGQQIAKKYHAHGPFIRRTVYLIGKDGTVRYSRRGKPDPVEVLATAT